MDYKIKDRSKKLFLWVGLLCAVGAGVRMQAIYLYKSEQLNLMAAVWENPLNDMSAQMLVAILEEEGRQIMRLNGDPGLSIERRIADLEMQLAILKMRKVDPVRAEASLKMYESKMAIEEERRAESEEETARANLMLDSVNLIVTANMVFNTPVEINIEGSPEIQLIVDLSKSQKELSKLIKAPGDVNTASIPVSYEMGAHLSVNGRVISIQKVSPEKQVLSSDAPTQWNWLLSPVEPGKHKLILSMVTFFETAEGEKKRVVDVFRREIKVTMSLSQRIIWILRSYWQFLWTALVIPLGGYIIQGRRTPTTIRTSAEAHRDRMLGLKRTD